MGVIAGHEERLVVHTNYTMRILDRNMAVLSEFPHKERSYGLTADEQAIYVAEGQSAPPLTRRH